VYYRYASDSATVVYCVTFFVTCIFECKWVSNRLIYVADLTSFRLYLQQDFNSAPSPLILDQKHQLAHHLMEYVSPNPHPIIQVYQNMLNLTLNRFHSI